MNRQVPPPIAPADLALTPIWLPTATRTT
jgi:hypothetical protein